MQEIYATAISIRDQLRSKGRITPDIQELAYKLYLELRKVDSSLHIGRGYTIQNPYTYPRPVKCGEGENQTIRPEPLSNYFSDLVHVNYLVDWILLVLPIIRAVKTGGFLPSDRDDRGYQAFFDCLIDTYAKELQHLPVDDVIASADLQILQSLCASLKSAVAHYLKGQPSIAYNVLAAAINKFDAYLPPDSIAFDISSRAKDLYKVRVSDDLALNKMDMLHLPFEQRGKASTNRYSIPGLPCLYLGSSPLICWEELNRPNKDNMHTSLFVAKDELKFLDFSVPPIIFIEMAQEIFEKVYGPSEENVNQVSELYREMKLYALLWPLIAACSIRVKNRNDPFKPEYIVPQLLLQWVQQSAKYDGICYFSTKINHYNFQNIAHFRNYALPVKSSEDEGYCKEIQNLFHDWTAGVPWPIFELHKSTVPGGGNGKESALIEVVDNIKIYYHQTDFCKLESLLHSVLYPDT
ncbi:hypothetical protein [Paenibacillus pini]|uniref:RES domain-containing protein n=1 Tax=Paenibacillus pini JCM 16418 TaxID=1236976 RepID=W7YIC1_9BACL|nr:hypothetical protein [Paenibacillus pini]GAF07368.1 hypothetical protein JCM16418_1382 [Paenibacillus pini JCM 16418]